MPNKYLENRPKYVRSTKTKRLRVLDLRW